jgi:hypothetical protein
MKEQEELLQIFAHRKKPDHFTNYKHCKECKVHDLTLINNSRENISFKELGNLSWNPISFSTIEGFLYYLPALARLAAGKGDKYFLDQFLIHVNDDARINAFTVLEKKALTKYLKWLSNEMGDEIEYNMDTEDLEILIEKLSSDIL